MCVYRERRGDFRHLCSFGSTCVSSVAVSAFENQIWMWRWTVHRSKSPITNPKAPKHNHPHIHSKSGIHISIE